MSAYAVISGRLGVEPELRFTNSGTPVINLSIANNRSIKVGDKRESVCELKHNFAAPARLCFKNCAATLCFPAFFPDFKASLPDRDKPHATTNNI